MPAGAPDFAESSFLCPHCDALTGQSRAGSVRVGKVMVATMQCQSRNCAGVTVWVGDWKTNGSGKVTADDQTMVLVWPAVHRSGAAPNADLNDDIRADLNEARSIVIISPRGAAALARLALQKVCIQLGLPGKNINEDIGDLVQRGLPVTIQQALDVVRVTGNEAVHPGSLDLRDDRQTAVALLELVNLVADQLISNPKRVADLYSRLPATKLAAIDERDGRA